jgi:hypothetical protein
MKEKLQIINEARGEFQRNTFFIANYIKCSIRTFSTMNELFDEGQIKELGLHLRIDESVPFMEIRVGMGDGPTYTSAIIC